MMRRPGPRWPALAARVAAVLGAGAFLVVGIVGAAGIRLPERGGAQNEVVRVTEDPDRRTAILRVVAARERAERRDREADARPEGGERGSRDGAQRDGGSGEQRGDEGPGERDADGAGTGGEEAAPEGGEDATPEASAPAPAPAPPGEDGSGGEGGER